MERLGQKQEAKAFARSAARLVAQRGEAETDVTCRDAVDAAVATSFAYIMEAQTVLYQESANETYEKWIEHVRHKSAQAWASIQPYLLNARLGIFEPEAEQDPLSKYLQPAKAKKPESLSITLARTAALLRWCSDDNSANVLREWKYALFPGQPAECDALYPEIHYDPADASAPLWERSIAVNPRPELSPLAEPLQK